jgi:hypothetical protein
MISVILIRFQTTTTSVSRLYFLSPFWARSTIPHNRISFILVQVKNRKKRIRAQYSRSRIAGKIDLVSDLTLSGFPYGLLWMELGVAQAPGLQSLDGQEEPNQLGLILTGLHATVYPCISEDNGSKTTASLIAQILVSWPDPLKSNLNDFSRAAIKNMLPLLYE